MGDTKMARLQESFANHRCRAMNEAERAASAKITPVDLPNGLFRWRTTDGAVHNLGCDAVTYQTGLDSHDAAAPNLLYLLESSEPL